MPNEVDLLRNEIGKIKARISKSGRRIASGKLVNGESEEDRVNRLSHILGKKEERLTLIQSGKEV